MQSSLLAFCLLPLQLISGLSLPLSSSLNVTSYPDSNQSVLFTALNSSSANLTSAFHLYNFVKEGLDDYYDSRYGQQAETELYKVVIYSFGPTMEIVESSDVRLHLRRRYQFRGSESINHLVWYYNENSARWRSKGDAYEWEEGPEFKATTAIDWGQARLTSIQRAINALDHTPDTRILDSSKTGPWRTISIVKFRQPPKGFWDELVFRFHAIKNFTEAAYSSALDALVGDHSEEAILVPPEYTFRLPKNPWGWGQDNRFTRGDIGPYTFFDYLSLGVNLVTKTMGGGYYKDAQLMQVKIRCGDDARMTIPAQEVDPKEYSGISLFFKWSKNGESKLLVFHSPWWAPSMSPPIEELGNMWSGWAATPCEYDWSESPKYLEYMDDHDPGRWLAPMDIKDIHVTILRVFQIWQEAYKQGKKDWGITNQIYLCKPDYPINRGINGQIVYYFPNRFLVGTTNEKVVEVKYATIQSNSTNTPTLPMNLTAIT